MEQNIPRFCLVHRIYSSRSSPSPSSRLITNIITVITTTVVIVTVIIITVIILTITRSGCRSNSGPNRPRDSAAQEHFGLIMSATPYNPFSKGAKVFDFAKMVIGEQAMSHIVHSGQKLRLPWFFWPACCRHCFHRVITPALRMSLKKGFRLYMKALRKGYEPQVQKRSWQRKVVSFEKRFWHRKIVSLLEKTLSPAGEACETQVVYLDRYAVHQDTAVAEAVEFRGHVLLLHGGGTTAYEQVNDTHLHATLQARMKTLEIAVRARMKRYEFMQRMRIFWRNVCRLSSIWAHLPHHFDQSPPLAATDYRIPNTRGYEPQVLPKLSDTWLRGWRQRYGVVNRVRSSLVLTSRL